MRLGFSYGRFSFRTQKDGRSEPRQVRAAHRWAKRNKVRLDRELSMFDEALSAYWGDHVMKGALGRFVALCGTPRVPPGSVLIVENFDRLSRQEPDDAWELFRSILLKDVDIVVLSMGKTFTRASLNSFEDRIVVQAAQKRAHEESATKAERLKDVWAARRRKARKGRFRPTKLPAWVRKVKVDGRKRLELVPERVAVILEMVRLSELGEGGNAIAAALNARRDEWPCWLKCGHWENWSVNYVLRQPALWGGWQAQRRQPGGKRFVNVGEPIPDCYPPVIDRERHDRLVRALSARRQPTGRKANPERTTLRGLVRDARTGRPLRLRATGVRPNGRLPLYLDRETDTGRSLVVDYHALESAVLRVVQQWTPDALSGNDPRPRAAAVRELEAALREAQERREALEAALRSARAAAVPALADAIDRVGDEEAALSARLAAESDEAGPVAQTLSDAQSVLASYLAMPAAERGRASASLNVRLRELLSGVYCYRHDLAPRKAAVYVQVRPRVGPPANLVIMVGRPPAGWAPLDVAHLDFRSELRGT